MVSTRVYVGGLPKGSTERDLERFFRGYGRLREILLKRGFAFVEFDDYRDADDAVYDLNGTKLLGERVTVDIARGTPRGRDQMSVRRSGRRSNRAPIRTNYRLIVQNLASSTSWQDLKDFMRQAGEVTYADAHKQRRNEGVVEFASSYEMKKAILKLDNMELSGRRVHLIEDKKSRRSRSRSPRRSRSRSRSRHSRSRSHSRRSSHSKSKSRSRSRSADAAAARDRDSRSRSRKMSVDRSRSNSRDKSMIRAQSKIEPVSKSMSKSRKMSVDRFSRERSIDSPRSRLRSRTPKRRSGSREERSRSRTRSARNGWGKSRSASRESRSRSRTLSAN